MDEKRNLRRCFFDNSLATIHFSIQAHEYSTRLYLLIDWLKQMISLLIIKLASSC